MDLSEMKIKVMEFIKKYRYVVLVLAVGIGLMMIPEKTSKRLETDPTTAVAEKEYQTEELTRILSQIKGAGKVQVLLTVYAGEKMVYQTDQDTSNTIDTGSLRCETVIVTDGDRAEHGLVQQILGPEYRGAIVVCQGADNASVRLAIVEAVANATGLGADRISVLKMK